MKREFHYYDGQAVYPGDRVRTAGGRLGKVAEIIQPGTSAAEDYSAPEGGVLISEEWNGVASPLLLTPPDGKSWEDIELIARAS